MKIITFFLVIALFGNTTFSWFNLLCFRSPRRRRSRSSSRSKRSRHRRSRSRSREWRWRSRSQSQDRSEREKDRERRQKGLPSIKIQTLSGMCCNRNKPVKVVWYLQNAELLESLLHASHSDNILLTGATLISQVIITVIWNRITMYLQRAQTNNYHYQLICLLLFIFLFIN